MSNTVKMTAPVKGGGDSTKLDVEIVPSGFQLCTLYGMATIGTHDNRNPAYAAKNKIIFMFEFPQEKRVFYEGDDAKPSVAIEETNYSMHEKANLRSMVEGMVGKMTDEAAADFDLGSLLGQVFVANMEHNKSKDGTKTYSNIKSLAKLDEKTRRMFGLEGNQEVEKISNPFFYHFSQGFESENFKNLPSFIRKKNQESHEGKAHTLAGGVFAEPDNNNNNNNNSSGAPAKRKLIMLVNDYSYEEYSQSWTDEQLVENGKAKWSDSAPTSAPAPQSASAPAGPNTSAPAPKATEAPLGTHQKIVDGRLFSLINPAWNLDEMIAQGWTIVGLVEASHGNFQ